MQILLFVLTSLEIAFFNASIPLGLCAPSKITKGVLFNTSKRAGLIAFYILGFLAIASMIFSGFKKISN